MFLFIARYPVVAAMTLLLCHLWAGPLVDDLLGLFLRVGIILSARRIVPTIKQTAQL
ncbi:MAG: hypothetical protein J0G36_11940 [Afipia sp.]|nr:hypothetical protein [Afipia sp.]